MYRCLLLICIDGSDFVGLEDIRSFPIGAVNGDEICLHIEIIGNDKYTENNEYFRLHIKLVDLHAWVFGIAYVTVHIHDDDGKWVTGV